MAAYKEKDHDGHESVKVEIGGNDLYFSQGGSPTNTTFTHLWKS